MPLQGEALRQLLVNRYYGNFRTGGRRDSLTVRHNSALVPVGPNKNQSGGCLCFLLFSVNIVIAVILTCRYLAVSLESLALSSGVFRCSESGGNVSNRSAVSLGSRGGI